MNKQALVSVVITSKNEEDVIGNLLSSITRQTYNATRYKKRRDVIASDYKNVEIILVDNNSTDETLKIAKDFAVRCYTFGPERSAQRNFGAKKSRGKYILFLDADMELTPKVLQNCIEIAEKDRLAGVVIPEKSIAEDFWGEVKDFERSFYNEKGDITTDAARFFRRDVFFKVGGYDENITGPEDWDLAETVKKKGYKIGRSKEKIYHYEQAISLKGLAKKKFYYGLSVDKYLRKQKIGALSPKTIYFLRPALYKNWRRMLKHPYYSLSLFLMLFVETIAGGLGFIVGKIRND